MLFGKLKKRFKIVIVSQSRNIRFDVNKRYHLNVLAFKWFDVVCEVPQLVGVLLELGRLEGAVGVVKSVDEQSF